MTTNTNTSRIASALWRGLTGTPAEIAAELGLTRAQVSRALCSLMSKNDWITRTKEGRTYRYVGKAKATPKREAAKTSTTTTGQRVRQELETGASMTPAELADRLGLTRGQVSRALHSLFQREGHWITRTPEGRTYRYRGAVRGLLLSVRLGTPSPTRRVARREPVGLDLLPEDGGMFGGWWS